ncbi:TonB-dependent receptor [candidate division KSB1 bacterium]|nr:TonB-dependent receptor [candidate division KSB1 bacterium]
MDNSTGLGLSDVNVKIVETQQGTASQKDGEFIIDNIYPGEYTIEISAIGFEIARNTVVVSAGKATSINILLNPKVINMEKIVVTATRSPQLLEETADVTLVQTAGEIRAMGAVQVNDIIEYMPGVSSIGGTGSGQPFKRSVSLNGMPANYSLILLNGRRVLSSHIHTGANVNVVPPEHIERIELVKGASSALYGTDGMGGVLNIITKNGSTSPGISFISYGGTQNTYHNGISVAGSIGKYINHSLFSSWEQTDGTPIIEPVFRKDKLGYTMFHLMDQFDVETSEKFKASTSLHYMNSETPYRQNPKASWFFIPCIDLEYQHSDHFSLRASGYYSQWKSQLNNELNELASPVILFRYDGWKDQNILFGAEYIYRNFSRSRVIEHDQQSYGVFVNDEFRLGARWRFLTALRLDKVQNIEPVICPKLSVLYNLNENIAFRTSAGRGFKAPTIHELYETLYVHTGDIHCRAGNPDLEPEYSTTVNAGIDLHLSDRLSFILNGSYYSIENMITPVDHGLEDPTNYFPRELIPFITDSLVYIYRRENIHKGTIASGEMKILWHFFDAYTLETGFNISHNKNKDTGETLPYYPGQSLSFKLQGVQTLIKGINIGGFVGLNATMDRKIWRFKHDGEQQGSLNDYQKLDAGLSILFSNGYEFFVNGENLLGQELHLYEDVDFITQGTALYRFGIRLFTH